jgi:hypothetical protein
MLWVLINEVHKMARKKEKKKENKQKRKKDFPVDKK